MLPYRKNPAGKSEFVEFIQKFIKLLSIDPRPRPPLGHLEPWPQDTKRAEWELWKLEFKMPQLRGAAGQGRLIYLINAKQKEVGLVWVYTHGEFEKRPPDRTLKSVLQEIIEFSEVLDESKDSARRVGGETGAEEVAEEESGGERGSDS